MSTYTFIPAQKDCEDLWSQVYTIQARTCLRFGEISSGLVAFLMLTVSSWSVLVDLVCKGKRVSPLMA